MGDSLLFSEWYLQSDYDLETAEALLNSKRYVYCIFMCHLCLEKSLKGLYVKRNGEFPGRTHSLAYLVEKLGIRMAVEDVEFIQRKQLQKYSSRRKKCKDG